MLVKVLQSETEKAIFYYEFEIHTISMEPLDWYSS